MRLYRQKKKRPVLGTVLPLAVFAAVITVFLAGVNNASHSTDQEGLRIAQQAIDRAVVNCYAIEGAYPQDFSYLEEHYGVRVDHGKYLVVYQTLGSNIRPYVELVEKGTN